MMRIAVKMLKRGRRLQSAGAPIWGCDHLRQSIDDQKPLLDAGWECTRGIVGAISPQNALGDGSCAGWAPLQQCTKMMFEGICADSRIRDLGARSK